MRKLLLLVGAAGLFVAGGLALAQTPDPFGQAIEESSRQATPPPPAAVQPTPTPQINPSDVNDVPTPDAPPVPTHPVTPTPTAPPDIRPRYPIAIVQALDKVTTETLRFEAPVGQPVKYKDLVFTVRSCEATAPDEVERDAIAHVQIDFQAPTPQGQPAVAAKTIFKGWMFAASPSISPVENPTYDAWLIACKTAEPPPSAAKPAAPKPAAPKPPPAVTPPPPEPEPSA